MLTEAELFITPEVYETFTNDPEAYHSTWATMDVEQHPFYDFALYELDNYPRLKLKLQLQETLEQFVLNAYFYQLIEVKAMKKEGIRHPSARELVQHKLKQIYDSHDQEETLL